MGSYTFKWAHPAEEVFVTGTFDNWGKSVQLEKKDSVFEKTVELPKSEKILYKFVADGDWKHDPTARSETDHEGNVNNIVFPEDLEPTAAAATISTVGPGATTTAMAGEQPVEKSTPGAFPETPAPEDDQKVSVNPIPASEGADNPVKLAPGEKVPDPSTINSNTVTSGVHDDPELKSGDQEGDQTVSVAPIPATGGIGNPVQLQPGEKVPDPSTVTGNTVDSNVKLDKESYEKADASAPTNPPPGSTLQDKVTPTSAILSGPGPVIPESSTAMGNTADINKENMGPTISSVAPGSTTNQLAGEVPKEERGVPEVVSESQKEANVDPEASANPEAVEEKKEVEDELQKKVPEEEPASESGVGAEAGEGVAAADAVAAGGAVAANEGVKDETDTDPKEQDTVDEKAKESDIPQQTSTTTAERETADAVPEEVKESQQEANVDPEASASPDAVKEKSEVEQELLKKVPESEAQGEPAPTESAATATTAPSATITSPSGAPQLGDPTAGVAPITMDDKPMDSRDVSPMTKTPGKPEVTTGIDSTTTPRRNGPAAEGGNQKRQSFVDKLKGTPASSKTAESSTAGDSGKKEKRKSFFGKLKEKLKS